MVAGCVFDPFFDVGAALERDASPRDLRFARQANPENSLGIVGAWLTIDGNVDGNVESWGTTPADEWPQSRGRSRVYTVLTPLAGVDGRLGTLDDRVLLIGGGTQYARQGGEPTSPSAEILLPPRTTR